MQIDHIFNFHLVVGEARQKLTTKPSSQNDLGKKEKALKIKGTSLQLRNQVFRF